LLNFMSWRNSSPQVNPHGACASMRPQSSSIWLRNSWLAFLQCVMRHPGGAMADDRQTLREHREALMQKGLAWVRRARKFQTYINLIYVLGGAALSGIGGAMDGGLVPSSGDGLITAKGLFVWLGVIAVLIGGILLYLIQDEAPALLSRAAALEAEAQKHLDEREALLSRLESLAALDLKRLALLDANRLMRETLEQSLLEPTADVPASAQLMLDAALHLVISSIGFEPHEEWAISIFQVQGDELVRIAAGRADRLAERNGARSWQRNQGFVGSAWSGGLCQSKMARAQGTR